VPLQTPRNIELECLQKIFLAELRKGFSDIRKNVFLFRKNAGLQLGSQS
jgi:hypothetical protein